MKKGIIAMAVSVVLAVLIMISFGGIEKDFIRYAEFNVPYDALYKAMNIDIQSQNEKVQINWIDVLAYLGAKYGGDFDKYKSSDLDSVVQKLKDGENIKELTKDMQYFDYYHEVYTAVLSEFLGTYSENATDSQNETDKAQEYGLKAYSPIASTFPFAHFDDFGASRSYGFKRRHLGHDLMCATGTPVVAIEGGVVECMGWNQYGGWRVGIRSHDSKRYYYYAHLRQNRPFHIDLNEGDTVDAGDVIGYVGHTGYSTEENVNGIDESHLHLGIQLIFDESQKECDNEIWIDVYDLTLLLQHHKSAVTRDSETKEFYSEAQLIAAEPTTSEK